MKRGWKRNCLSIVSPFLRVPVSLLSVLLLTLLFAPAAFAAGGDPVSPFPLSDQQAGKQFSEAMAIDSQGNAIVTGYTVTTGTNDFYTVKFKADGTGVAWTALFDKSSSDDRAVAVVVDSNNDVIVTGSVGSGQAVNIQTIKYNGATGAIISQHTWNGGANGADYPTAIAVDGGNNVYVAGYSYVASENEDWVVLKYKYNEDKTLSVDTTFAANGVLTYGGPANKKDMIASIATGSDGKIGSDGIIVAGRSSYAVSGFDYLTRKYDLNGNYLWERRYSSAGSSYTLPGPYVKIDSSGNVAFTGNVLSGANMDIYTAKFNGPDGGIIWQKTYAGAYGDEPRALWIDAAGDVYVTGYTWTLAGRYEFYTVRYSSAGDGSGNGVALWEKTFGSGGDNDDVTVPTGLVVADSADEHKTGVFVTGFTYKSGSGDYDFQTIKYKKDTGNQLWQKSYGAAAGKDDMPAGIGLAPDGRVYVSGWTNKMGTVDSGVASSGSTTVLIKDSTAKNWPENRWSNCHVKITSGANAGSERDILGNTGDTLTISTGNPFPYAVAAGDAYYIYDPQDYDYVVIKYDQGLLNAPTNLTAAAVSSTEVALTWSDNSSNEDGFKIERKICTEATYTVIDTILSNPTTTATYNDTDAVQPDTKYCYQVRAFNAAEGDTYPSNEAHALTTIVPMLPPSWSSSYDGGIGHDYATAIAVGPDNNPVVTGYSLITENSYDYYTIKFDRQNGSIIWDALYDGDQSGGHDQADTVAVDSNNGVIVSGYSWLFNVTTGNTNDIYTVKYPAQSPVVPRPSAADFHNLYKLWQGVYNGPSGSDDYSVSVATAVDGSDNVAMVGYGMNAAGNMDLYVVKYSSSGALLWQATPYDRSGGSDVPSAVGFDASGNVFVTGYTCNATDTDCDIVTRKYNGSTGSAVWTDVYPDDHGATDYGIDEAKAIAIDSFGDVYITGYITNSSGNTDLYTIKYYGADSANPRTPWEGAGRSFDGEAHGDDKGVSIEVDPIDGRIVVAGTTLTDTGNNDYHLIWYLPNTGLVDREKTLYRDEDDTVAAMAMDVSGNVCVAGTTLNAATSYDMMSIKYNYEGAILGATTYNGEANGQDHAAAVAINALGEAFVAGYSMNSAGNYDYAVFKCAWDSLQAPSPLNATPSYTSIALAWSDNSTSEQGFLLQRKVGACASADIANTCSVGDPGCPWTWSHDIPLNTVPYTSYIDQGLNINETYCYRIQAYGDKLKGEASRWVGKSATTLVPERPSGLTATAANTTEMNLSWMDNTDIETGFIIERCLGASCEYPTAPASAGTGTVTYQDTGVCQNTAYTYRVKAYKTGEWETVYSEPPVSATTTTAGTSPVLTATRTSEAQINLTWSDTTSDEIGYEVWRKVEACGASGLSFEKISNMPANETYFMGIDPALWNQQGVLNTTSTTPPIDMTDASGQARITASNGAVELYTKTNGGGSAGTYNASQMYLNNLGGFLAGNFDIQFDFTLPDGQITASQSNIYARMKVSFPDSAGGANYIYVERVVTSSGNGYNAYSMVNGVGGSITQALADHTSGKLRIARSGSTITTYYWTGSAWQSYLTATISSAVSDVRISQFGQRNNAVTLKTVIDNFKVVTGNTAFSDTGLAPSTVYCYKVKAFKNASCRWEVESTTSGQTTTISAPSGLTATPANTTQINLGWTNNTPTATGFIVERCFGAGCTNFAQVDGPTPTVGAGVTTYNDTAVCADNTYRYQVRAYNAGWTPTTSDPSNTATAVTPAIANLLLNPSFEVSPDFTNWTTAVGTTSNTYVDTAVFYDGVKSYRLQTTSLATLGRSQAVTVTPGRQYILSGYLRTNLTQGQVQCDVQGTGIDSTGLKIVNNDANDNDTWVYLSETVAIPAGTTSVNIRCFGDSSPRGPAYFDKIRFVPEPLISLTAAKVSEAETLLTWTDVFTDETGFKIERCKVVPPDTSCSDFSPANTVGSSVMFYYDSGLEPNTTYRYQVRSYKTATCNGEWNSPYSNIAEASTTIPATNLSAATGNTTRIDLAWKDETELESETIVERCQDSGCTVFGEIDRAYRDVTNMLMLKMDEQSWSGTGLRDAADVSGYGRHGYSNNGAVTIASGKSGRAGSFDGSNDYVSAALDGTTLRQFTIEFWLYPTGTQTNKTIFRWTSSDINNYSSFIELERISTASPNTTVRWKTGNFYGTALTDITIPVNDWTHLALTYDGSTWRFYKNGVLAGSSTAARSNQSYASYVFLGGGYYYYYSGYLDEFAIYGRTLAETEVLARAQKPGLKTYADTMACENTTYAYQVKTIRKMSNSGGGNWTKRLPITISNFQPNYQIRTSLTYTTGMLPNFDDIRFYDATAGAELPYWIETKIDNTSATVWFRTGMSNNVVMYYGNSSATSSSSSKRVFEVYDDFGDGAVGSIWSALTGTGSITESGGALNFSYTGAEANDWTSTRQGKALKLNELPPGDFHAQVKLNSYTVNVSTQAGLSVYGSDGSAYLFGRYRDASNNNVRLYQNSTYVYQNSTNTLPLYLAVRRVGASYYFYLSTNNSTWTQVGSTYSAVTFNNIVLYGRESSANDLSFSMDDFVIRKYVSTEPAATIGTIPESPVLPATYFVFNEWEIGYSNPAEATTSSKGAAPALAAAPYSESEIDLSWTHTQTDETGFRIEWCKVGLTDCTLDNHFTANTPIEKAADTAAHRHSGLEIGATYKYRIVAYKTASCGWTTDYSAIAETTTIAPPAPSNLKAVPANTTKADLTWNDNTGAETGFTLQRCEVTETVDCTQDSQFTTIASPGVNNTSTASYPDTTVGMCAGKTFRYRVKANNSAWPGGSTGWSNVAPAVTPAIGNILPDSDFENGTSNWSEMGPVTSFDTSTVYSGAKSLRLNATGATLGRKQSVSVKAGRQYSLTGWLRANLTNGKVQCDVYGASSLGGIMIVNDDVNDNDTWVNLMSAPLTIPNGVTSVDVRCFGDGSPQGTAYFDIVQLVPVPVVSLTATRISETQIDLKWDDNMSDETGFDVLWCSGSSSCSPTTALVSGTTTTTRSHTSLTASTIYRYLVRGYKTASSCTGGKWTTDSNIAEATTDIMPPVNLAATAVNTTRIDVSWTKNTVSENQFRVQRCQGSSTCTDFADFPNNTTSSTTYQDTSLCKETIYRYRVRAEKTSSPTWESDWSAATPNDSAQTATPIAPSNPSAAAVTDTQVDVSWADNTMDETRFDIQKCLDGVCDPPVPVDSASRGWTATTGARTYSVTGLLPSRSYCFSVRAHKDATCNSGWDTDYTTPQVCDQTFSAMTSGLTATAINSMKIQLDWDDNSSDEDGFELEVQVWNGKWVRIATLGAGVKTFIDTMGIEPQKQYHYRVRATRGEDKSPYSEGSVTTPAYSSGDHTCEYTIIITVSGSGSVSPSPSGVSCGTNCYAYKTGAVVTFTAKPSTTVMPKPTFTGWSGACTGTSTTCALTMDGDKGVTATFSQ